MAGISLLISAAAGSLLPQQKWINLLSLPLVKNRVLTREVVRQGILTIKF
jgi:hypothetical protein